jgi:dipeptidyl aminopeptidase/acylaminoacyl peptidase
MRGTQLVSAALLAALAVPAASLAQQARGLTPDDVYNLKDVRDPQRSPDGQWVAYVVSRAIKDTDKNDSDIWMASWDGASEIQLTSSAESESRPRWSPDGKYLAFVSSRQNAKHGQLWLMNRKGGEAVKVTDLKGSISDYVWSPDGSRIVLVVDEPDPTDPQDDDQKAGEKKKTPPPIVINRYHWKQDVEGYLRGERSHLYLFDVASRKAEALTSGTFSEENPSWSPDGSTIAFLSRRGPGDPDRTTNADIYLVDARTGAQPRALTNTPIPEMGRPAWSPDGKSIAYLLGEEMKWYAYDQPRIMVSPVAGGAARPVAAALDRPVDDVAWSADGSSLVFTVTDDRLAYIATAPVAGGEVRKFANRPGQVIAMSPGKDGAFAVTWTTDGQPAEVFALEPSSGTAELRRLSHRNDDWLAGVRFGQTTDFTSTSPDGTEVHGVLTRPAGAAAGEKLPLLLRIHGGPSGQDGHDFSFERELFAANGYAVLAVNYRGSNGRGSEFQKAIYADWGHKEVIDLLGAVDQAVKSGVADPDKLGIGGWSYGCILTDYTIASDTRFKAATCGAGSANQFAMYGVDQYIIQWETEIGPPWKSPEPWMKVSYPFFHADRIKTPTLYLGGERDFNVPIIGNEQMYQALRSLGVPTELVIYPDQFHGITVPSYKVDRFQRYLAWYEKYLKGSGKQTSSAGR